MTLNQENIVEELHKGVCTVRFTKVDGTVRSMHCTLNPALAPDMSQSIQEDGTGKERNTNNVSVWDTDINSWRSFRIDSILEFNSPTLLKG